MRRSAVATAPVAGSDVIFIPTTRSVAIVSDLAGSSLSGGGLRSAMQAREVEGSGVVTLSGDILFGFDRAEIRASALPTLRRLAALIAAKAPGSVVIEGHTDWMGSDLYNLELSRRRADSVRAHLIERLGADPAPLRTAGFGADDPAGRQLNRRVEVILSP